MPSSLTGPHPCCASLPSRWAEAMAAQGSGGAFEISQRMTAMVGWGATTDFREDWTWWVWGDVFQPCLNVFSVFERVFVSVLAECGMFH